MNIACYNLRFGGAAANRVHWQRVFDAAQPDLFLAQECCDPIHYLTPEQHSVHARGIVWRAVDNMRWGSAVFVRGGHARLLQLDVFSGYVTGVRHPGEKRQQHNLFLLERMRREFNLMNAWQIANPNRDLPQTLRWGRDKTEPYHCDAVFLPASWYRHLEGCEVLSSPEWDRLSDHNPVVARLA